MNDVSTTTAVSVFRPFVPRLAARWDEDAPGRRVRVLEASLLGLDISGFTALSERLAERGKLGAEELIVLISRCYSGLIDIADRYGGDVLKFRGDALLLLFDGERHEERAALAALAMQKLIGTTGSSESSVGPVQLSMASGLVSGPCHFFLLGRHQRELIVCGPTASATLELEDAAEAGEVLVSSRTAEALVGLVASERNGAFLLRSDAAPDGLPDRPVEDGGPRDLSALLPPALREPVEEGAVEAEHRQATAAFVKFGGTDSIVDDPEAAAASLGELADVVSAETFERSITWLESDIDRDGGKMYLVAGAPATGGDDEQRMLRAVRAIVDAHAGPPVAVGVNRGRVLAGPIGSASRRTYAVMGDTVNLAARLTARAAKGEILATGDVLQRSRTQFETTARQFLMKGKAKPVTGHSVGALLADAVEQAQPPLPLVGREEELGTLREALDAARMRQSRAVELVGDAGAGKSRLLEELVTNAVGFQLLRTRCEAYSASTPFAPLRALLGPLVGILPDDAPEVAGAKLTTFAQAAMPDLAHWLPLLALPFDAEVATTPEVEEIDPIFRRDRLHDVLDQLLTRMLMMPTAILVEDTHWLDDASQLVLAKLAQPGPKPWLVVVTRRPSGPPLPGAELIDLAPLSAVESRALALAAAGETALSDAELTALTDRAAGNALFIRELAVSPSVGDALPETVESLLTSRIDTLHPADRLLLRHAAVIGPSFGIDLLEEILPEDAGDLERWNRLADFVAWDGPSRLRFRHDLVHAAAYDGLSFTRRREIHALVGAAIERRSFDPDLDAEVLSLHFLAADEWAKAWHYAVLAGDDARSKYANIDAATFYERALAAAGGFEPGQEELARVCEALGDVCELAARYHDADAAYERALAEGAPRVRLLRKRGVVAERHGAYDDALALYDAIASGGDPEARLAAQLGRAIVLYRQGRIDESAETAAAAAELAIALSDQASLADAYYIRAAAEGDRGGPATHFLDLALPIFEELGLLHRQATVINNMGVRAYYEGRWDDASALYLRSGEVVERAGDVLTGAHATNNRAEILLDQGRHSDAIELIESALRTYRSAKFPIGEAFATKLLGRIAAEQGRFAESHALLNEARERFAALGSESLLIEADARQAQAFVLEGRHADAAALASDALRRMAAIGEVGVRLVLLHRLLGVAAVQARTPAEAPPHFDEGLRIARELGADYEVARTLQARVATGLGSDADAAEAAEIMERLGVVSFPSVPLP
ncbi:MAG TPA: adenylate/guanylate cyclase domain-containing protein [Gaiellaceae bacterium]|nr:adenylate/guanylate cyclase domain-containing protein [Gaiellaceae bacterium]